MHIRWHYKESRSNKIAKGDKTPQFCRKWNFSTSLHESAPRCPWLLQRCSSGTLSCTGALLCTGAQSCTYALVHYFALVHNYSTVHFALWRIRNLLVHLYRNHCGTLLAQKKFAGAHVQKYSPGALFCTGVLFFRSTPYPPPPSVQKCTSHFGLNGSRGEYFKLKSTFLNTQEICVLSCPVSLSYATARPSPRIAAANELQLQIETTTNHFLLNTKLQWRFPFSSF